MKKLVWAAVVAAMGVSCQTGTTTTLTSNADTLTTDSLNVGLPMVDSVSVDSIGFSYDSVLYGKCSKMIGFSRRMCDDSLKILDTICYKTVELTEPEVYYSKDLQMNNLRGPVRSIHTSRCPIHSNVMQKDSTWKLVIEPFNRKKMKTVDSTLFTQTGDFQSGNIIYENWNVKLDKKNKIKRDVQGRVRDLFIDAKEYGVLGSRFFYDREGRVDYYTVYGYENSYKTIYHYKNGFLRTAEMEGVAEGTPYLYKRTFTPVDTDDYGNWTIRICKEFYFPGTLYLQEGQEENPEATGFSTDNLEMWNMIIQWQNSWDKVESVSQFSVFMETPSNARGWVEIRSIEYEQKQ